MSSKSIVFVDSRVSNYQSLIDSLTEPYEVFILDGDSDGLDQMAGYLSGRSGLDAIHVISHGSQGALYLGSTVLNSGNLSAYGTQLGSIGNSLTQTGDILLYGCNVAQGNVGFQFVSALAELTGADVAASEDATGAVTLGGDGVLELATGSVEAAGLLVTNLAGLLAVNTAPTFLASDGQVTTDFFGSDDQGHSITLQTDGKILLAGNATNTNGYYDFALARYNANGSLDTSFDGDGKLTTDFFGSYDIGESITLQTDGKILVAGYAFNSSGSPAFALARYNANGSLDTSFDGDGKLTTDFFGSGNYGNSITLQSDGKILMAGSAFNGSGGQDFALARYNANGSLDTSFDGDGKLTTDFFGSGDQVRSITLQADGKILVAGIADNGSGRQDFALARYNANGSLDTSFDGDGKLTTDFFGLDDQVRSIILQADGKILVAGYATNNDGDYDLALARYNANGSLDTSFDGDGKLTTDFFVLDDIGESVTLQTDGKFLVAGSAFGGGSSDFLLARYNANGSLDTSFDGDGKVMVNIGKNGNTSDSAYAVNFQADGKIVVAGYSDSSGQSDFALARLNADGSLDTSFSPPENTLDNLPAFTESYSASVILDPDVQILDTELASTGNYNGATLTLARHGSSSSQDVFSAATSALTTLTPGSYFAVDGVTIGRVTTNSAGTLTLTFNTNATQSLVNKAMQQIAYANTSDAPPASVQIDWTFNDGNTGAQGTGGALSVTGSTTVQITATNDYPVLSQSLVDQSLSANTPFSYTFPADAFTDPDLETLSYSIRMNDGTGVPPWLTFTPATRTFSGTPGVADAGDLDIVVTATDSANATASYTVRLSVSATPVADTLAPTATTFSPADEATGVAVGSNIVVTFSEAIARGTGNVVLTTTAGAIVATYDAAASGNIAISGNTLTLNPSADLTEGTGYKVEFAAGSIKDLVGNSFAGTTSYNFTTASGDTTPAGSNLVAAIQSSTGVTLNPVLQATLTARLQQMFDTGTYSALAASVAMQAFSTSLKSVVDANGGTGAFLAHVSAVVAAMNGGTEVPGFGAGGASPAAYLDPLEAQSAGVTLMGVQEMALE